MSKKTCGKLLSICTILHKLLAPVSQSTSVLYNYIKTVFTTRRKNPPETFASSVRQLWANSCTWPRQAEKKRARARKLVKGPSERRRRRRSSGLAHTAEPKCAARWAWHSKQECFQIVKRDRKKERRGRREGGRKEKRRNESRGDMCLTLRNSSGSNLHIYNHSPKWAHCERRTTTTLSEKWKRNLCEEEKRQRTKGEQMVVIHRLASWSCY